MEEITLPMVMTVRSAKVLIMFHSSCAAQLEFFMGRCSQTRSLPLAEGWVPLGFGEISLDKSRPLMANWEKISLINGVVEFLLRYNA